jgi:hypothetical protein
LKFGNGGAAGPTSTLFFTAGPDDEQHGMFGELNAVPEPATWMLLGFGLMAVALLRAYRTQSA